LFTLICFNAEGGRGEARLTEYFDDPSVPKPVLRALCVGVNRYAGVRNFPGLKNLWYPESDARALSEVFAQHRNSALYRDARVYTLLGAEVTVAAVLKALKTIAAEASPNDLAVLYLSGHGHWSKANEAYDPYNFAYVCAKSDQRRPQTLLSAQALHDALRTIPCRKLVLLDACRSGTPGDPIRALNRGGPGFMIFAACKSGEAALEPDPERVKKYPAVDGLRHGLFADGLLVLQDGSD
jgi:hypothetical protein